MPTTPTPAFLPASAARIRCRCIWSDIFTVSAPLAGLPAISIPCGQTTGRLPIGLQLTGRAWDESTLLRIAHHYERATPWAQMTPDIG